MSEMLLSPHIHTLYHNTERKCKVFYRSTEADTSTAAGATLSCLILLRLRQSAWMLTSIWNQKMVGDPGINPRQIWSWHRKNKESLTKASTVITVDRYTFSSSTRRRCSIIVYVKRNWDSNRVGFPTIKFFKSLSSGISSRHIMITVPMLSSPLLPARPAIWIYSPGSNFRCSFPSNFLKESNTTCWVYKNMLRDIFTIRS